MIDLCLPGPVSPCCSKSTNSASRTGYNGLAAHQPAGWSISGSLCRLLPPLLRQMRVRKSSVKVVDGIDCARVARWGGLLERRGIDIDGRFQPASWIIAPLSSPIAVALPAGLGGEGEHQGREGERNNGGQDKWMDWFELVDCGIDGERTGVLFFCPLTVTCLVGAGFVIYTVEEACLKGVIGALLGYIRSGKCCSQYKI